jgi:hypothetical protein
MPLKRRLFSEMKLWVGVGFWRLQLAFLAIAIAVAGLFWLL